MHVQDWLMYNQMNINTFSVQHFPKIYTLNVNRYKKGLVDILWKIHLFFLKKKKTFSEKGNFQTTLSAM